MAEVKVGDIVVRLIADAKQLDKGLQEAGVSLDKFGKKAKDAGKNVEASFTGVNRLAGSLVTRLAGLAAAFVSVRAVVQAFNSAIGDVNALDRLSQATGTSIAQLQSLRFAAEQVGADFNALSQVFATHSQRMTEALQNPASTTVRWSPRIGQAVKLGST